MLRERKNKLLEIAAAERELLKQLKEKTARVKELQATRTEAFIQITRKLFDNVNTIYRSLVPNASLEFTVGNANPPQLGAIRYESEHSWLMSLTDDYSDTNRCTAALAIILCAQGVSEASGVVVGDFRATLSYVDHHAVLHYIFRMMQQRIIVLSKTHATAPRADKIFWLYRNYQVRNFADPKHFGYVHILISLSQNECEVLGQNMQR